MKAIVPVIALLICGALLAQEPTVTVEAKGAAKAEAGQQWTLELKFTIPEGYHAYHKDNPGIGLAPDVTFTNTNGLKLAQQKWPEPKKKKDELGEEWLLEGAFTVQYIFDVPADAEGRLAVEGKHDTQFCTDEFCLMADGKFSANLEVTLEKPWVKLSASFAGSADAGGKAEFKLHFKISEGFHAYHKDNPGYGVAPIIQFTQTAGLTKTGETWPEPKKKEYDKDWVEWEYSNEFTLTYTFSVPRDAKGALELAGTWDVQVCDDDGCHQRTGKFTAKLDVKPAADSGSTPRLDPKPTVVAGFDGAAKAGGEAKLSLSITLPGEWVTYHPENIAKGGTGKGPEIVFTQLGGLELAGESWPEAVQKSYDGYFENVYRKLVVATYTFKVPAGAHGKISIEGTWNILLCDEVCIPHKGTFSAVLEVAAGVDRTRTDSHGFYLDFDYALEQAKLQGKPLLVDFNGRNCPPCRVMEARVFTLPEVKDLFKGFIIASVQNDIDDARYNELWQQYKPAPNAGVPYYAVIDHDGKVVRGIGSTLPADKRSHEFVAFLKGEAPASQPKPEPQPTATDPASKPAAESNGSGWPEGLIGPPYAATQQGFDFEAKFTTSKIKPGGSVTLELHFKLKESPDAGPYNLYTPETEFGIPLILKLLSHKGLEPVGQWKYPKAKVVTEEGVGTMHKLLGHVIVVQEFKVPDNTPLGTYRVWGTASGQYCDDAGCIQFNRDDPSAPDRMFGWVASLEVAADGAITGVIQPIIDPIEPKPETEKDSFLWFLLLAFFAGMITLLTPCVLPVIPLTIGFFVSQAEKGRSPLLTAWIYCTCIVASFTLFGLITSLTLGATGAQNISTNGWVNSFLGLLFLVFALSFLGLFELRVPTFMTAWFTKKQMSAQKEGKGYAKAFFSGSAFALISFSCTGPIAGAFLAGAAGGDIWLPTLAMLAFSTGMALPIFIMGQFPSVMKKLPKSGGWMNALKVVFGFIEIGLAIMYFSAAEQAFGSMPAAEWVNRYVVLAVWITVSLASGLYLFGFFRMPHDHEKTEQIGVVRALFAVAFISFALYLVPGLFGAKFGPTLEGILPLPPENGGIQLSLGGGEGQRNDAKKLPWEKNLAKGIETAGQVKKPIFIDFTGFN
ncbi:MAG: thioredoxin family protein [Planctomycetes bacterium]|nr:thioredoxin family protein [Planctomycetota bacterium]MCW8134034.1 thioredoxin family protein [Planctomycetota bacterium]